MMSSTSIKPKSIKELDFQNIKNFNNQDTLYNILNEVMQNSTPSHPIIKEEWSKSFTGVLKPGRVNDDQALRLESSAVHYIGSKTEWNKLQIEGKFKFRENKDGEKFYGINLAVSSYSAFISTCYLLNKEYLKSDEDSTFVLLVFKVPINFLNNSNFFDSKGQSNIIIKNAGNHQAVRLNAEIPISTEMYESITALEFKFDMTRFNDSVFQFQEGNLRHYAEFLNVYQSIVSTCLVQDICEMSTFQVIQATGGFYFDQFDIVNKMKIYIRCWDFVKSVNKLDQDDEVNRALPSTMKKFTDTYELLKEPFFKAGINPNSTEAEIAKLNRELNSILNLESQDKFKEENQKLKDRVGFLEEMMFNLTGGKIKFNLPSTAGSSNMEVEAQEPSGQGIGASPGLKRKKSSTDGQDDDDQ